MSKAGSISLNDVGEIQIIVVEGAFDAVLQPEFDRVLKQIAICTTTISLDMKQVDFMDSAGAGFIVSLVKQSQRNGELLEIKEANGQPLSLIQTLGIDKHVHLETMPTTKN